MNLIKRTDKNLIFGKFKVTKVIGSGSFGEVYEGYNIIDNQPVAIKVEDKSHNLNLLEKEGFYLYTLKGPGVPEVISFGYSGKYNILVQTLLGQSLGKIFFEKKHYFSIKDICMFSIQILERIEFVHSKFIIHRDIKPENFLIGRTDAYNIYIIDFGLSKKYKSSRTNKHIQFRLTRKFTGTARYASANSVRGGEQSRRDDLEAIGYMLLYFFSGARLPWQGVSCKEKAEKYSKIYTMKKELDLEDFCKKMPREIIDYMNYCKKLEFQENPNYAYLRGLFENVLKRMGTSNDLHFSWIKDTSVCKNVRNLSKKKASPQFRIFKQLKNSKDKPELIKKSLTTGKPLKNVQDEKLSNNQKIIIHKRFNSSGDYIYLKHNESEMFKSGIAQYNLSIGDIQVNDNIKYENDNKYINIPKKNKYKSLYYFSSNFNDLSCKNSSSKKLYEQKIKSNSMGKQESDIAHRKVFSFNNLHNKLIENFDNKVNSFEDNLNYRIYLNHFIPNFVNKYKYLDFNGLNTEANEKKNNVNKQPNKNVKVQKNNKPRIIRKKIATNLSLSLRNIREQIEQQNIVKRNIIPKNILTKLNSDNKEGKINKIKNMKINSNIKFNNIQKECKKLPTEPNNIIRKNNTMQIKDFQNRINKYKNTRQKNKILNNLKAKESINKIPNQEFSLPLNLTKKNNIKNRISNKINNNNKPTIISIYNNCNINRSNMCIHKNKENIDFFRNNKNMNKERNMRTKFYSLNLYNSQDNIKIKKNQKLKQNDSNKNNNKNENEDLKYHTDLNSKRPLEKNVMFRGKNVGDKVMNYFSLKPKNDQLINDDISKIYKKKLKLKKLQVSNNIVKSNTQVYKNDLEKKKYKIIQHPIINRCNSFHYDNDRLNFDNFPLSNNRKNTEIITKPRSKKSTNFFVEHLNNDY